MDVAARIQAQAAAALDWLPALLIHGHGESPSRVAESLARAMVGDAVVDNKAAAGGQVATPFFPRLPFAGGRGTAETQETLRVPDWAGGPGVAGRRVTVERCFSRVGGALLVRVPSAFSASAETLLFDAAVAADTGDRDSTTSSDRATSRHGGAAGEGGGGGEGPQHLPPSMLHSARCSAALAICRDVASRRTVEGRRRVVVVDGVCRMPAHAQVALGRIAESCTGSALFVMTCSSLACVEQRLRSRALCVGTPRAPPPRGLLMSGRTSGSSTSGGRRRQAAKPTKETTQAADDGSGSQAADDDDADGDGISSALAVAHISRAAQDDHYNALLRGRCAGPAAAAARE